tara:strand:+ start:351 stop:890 length:540 start_codon:yes stop_codon:yes gene_type:complete
MKLTKQKLEQLIIETYTRRLSDEGKPTNYPEYADKLTGLARDDYEQAVELADALGEPLNIEFDADTAKHHNIKISDVPKGYFDVDGPYFTHARYVMWANANGYPELKYSSEILPEVVRAFANAEGMDYEKTLSDVKTNLYKVKNVQMKKALGKFDVDKQMADVHGFDQDPFGYDPFEED